MILLNEYMKRKIKGKRYLGSGGTRVVYDLGNGYVFKIARSAYGIECNRMEVHLYRTSTMPVKKYFAKIIDYDRSYLWLIMKKYDRKFPNTPKYRQKLKKAVATFLVNGIVPSKGVGHYQTPYGPNLRLRRNKQIVVIDYGGFHYGRY